MQNDNLKSYLHLHVIVFIWGFTAVLGKLISLEALDLVWYRMLFASVIMTFVVLFNKEKIRVPFNVLIGFIVSGIIIALHWLTFYQAIKVSNVSITLACLSTGAFFASILEPIFYKRKIIWYEVLFGLIVIFGLGIIFKVETQYTTGIYLAVTSAFLSALFSVINGKYAKEYSPNVISVYELSSGFLFLSIYLFFADSFTPAFFALSSNDLLWLFFFNLYGLCIFGICQSNEVFKPIYSNAYHQFRTYLWNHFSASNFSRKRENVAHVLHWCNHNFSDCYC